MAKTDLVPLCICITSDVTPKGRIMKYPNFNKIDPAIRKNSDWSVYIDNYGSGMHYDKVENMGDGADCDCACTLVPKDFADAAAVMFPSLCKTMTESEWADFHDNRAHAHEPEEQYDAQVLQALAAKKALGIALTADDLQALDPDSSKPGIRRNKNKKWLDVKNRFTIHASCQGGIKKFTRIR